MMRAGKGTIQRAGTLQAYRDEIEALYRDADQMSADGDFQIPPPSEIADEVSRLHYIKATILSITGWGEVTDSQDIFAAGMDSLHAISLIRILKRALNLPELAPSTLYTNASPLALTRATFAMQGKHSPPMGNQKKDHLLKREGLLEEYKKKLDQLPLIPSPDKTTSPRVFILTGSTGALGSHILSKLLAEPSVRHIYCLNRADNSHILQQERNAYRHLPVDFPADRVSFHTCELSLTDLGLQPDVYKTLVRSHVTVIHCAWPVNFILPINAFRPQLDSVVNLARLVSASKVSSRFFFISSISSVMTYENAASGIPEEIIDMNSSVHPNGYAESKYISELLLQYASNQLRIDCSIFRVGQLAGAATQASGAWNAAEWFPSLVISSAEVGALPDSLGPSFDEVNWVPIDLAAEVIIDLISKEKEQDGPLEDIEASVYHLLNPRSIHWASIHPTICRSISTHTQKPLSIVSPAEWISKVRENLDISCQSSLPTSK